jgi:hypothetical protein
MRFSLWSTSLLTAIFLAANTHNLASEEQSPPLGISKDERGATVLRLPRGLHPMFRQQMRKASDDCASAKIDVWIEAGRVEYVIFSPDTASGGEVKHDTLQGFPVIRVGKDDCRIDIVISPPFVQ